MNDAITQEAYRALAEVCTGIGVGLEIWGFLNMQEGSRNNVLSAWDLGERQMKAGENLVILAAYIREGTLPTPDTIEYLNAR